jgi:hypothetical protein
MTKKLNDFLIKITHTHTHGIFPLVSINQMKKKSEKEHHELIKIYTKYLYDQYKELSKL